MGEGKARSQAARAWRGGLVIGCAGLLLAGCASMPDSGDLRGVETSQRPDSQVRVFPLPPRENAGPEEILQGFLEALTSDDPQFEMARKYLTPQASKNWHPENATTVLTDGPVMAPSEDHSGSDGHQYSLQGTRVATVNEQHAYEPAKGDYSEVVHLSQQRTTGHREWRIDRPPAGIVLGASDFQRIYRPVDKYYYALGPSSGSGGQPVLVADPVYVRSRVDPVTQTVRALLAGPTRWLSPVVRTSFPTGTGLKAGVRVLAPDDQNKLKVPLDSRADRVGTAQCLQMAAQILYSLQDLTSTGITEVDLQRSDGSSLCVLDKARAETVAPHLSTTHDEYQYFLDGRKRLVRLPATGSEDEPQPVPGPLGSGQQTFGSVAVSHDEARAAGVSPDRRSLFVADLAAGAPLGDPVLTSSAKKENRRLTAPSWDGQGGLWVADRDPDDPRLLLLEHGKGDPIQVATPGLDPASIEAVRVAADSTRIALLVDEHGETSLRVGRIERRGGLGHEPPRSSTSTEPGVSVAALRPAAPQMEDVTAMSWAGGSRLVVVGRESGGVQQMRYVQCDGSSPASNVLPGLTAVREIAASDDDRLPLVAHSDDGIVRMPPGEPWQTVRKEGTAPVYPG